MRSWLVLLVVVSLTAWRPPTEPVQLPVASRAVESPDRLTELEARSQALARDIAATDSIFVAEVRPLESMLAPFSDDTAHVRRIALSLAREARNTRVAGGLLASVLLVENPWLAPRASSSVGAVGLMQVMPFHAGNWGCDSDDLEAIEANICHGSRIFAHLLARSEGDVERALLRYNGCVRGRNTPDCHDYPSKVFARAGQALVRGWLGAVESPPTLGAQ